MAKRSKSGLKRKRQSARRAVRNQSVRSSIKTAVKRARQTTGADTAELHAAIRQIDAAARKGIVHRNAAARTKSRLIRHLARQGAAAPTGPATA